MMIKSQIRDEITRAQHYDGLTARASRRGHLEYLPVGVIPQLAVFC